MPLFSIIIPVYNTEKYLERCLDSILQQTFDDYELILVDDGSKDSSSEICDRYTQKNQRIRVIHKENGGVSSARNMGIELMRGEYVWFVDSDDYIEPGSLLELAEKIKFSRKDLYVFNKNENAEEEMINLDEFMKKYYFTYKLGFELWNKLYATSIIKKNNLKFDEEEKIGEDLLFNINYYSCMGNRISFISRNFYYYDIRQGSAMNTQSKQRLVQQMRLYDKVSFVLNDKLSQTSLQMLFLLHIISGISQARLGGMTAKEFSNMLDYKKYREVIANCKTVLKYFFVNEKASVLGRCKIYLFLFFMQTGKYIYAGKIMGLK